MWAAPYACTTYPTASQLKKYGSVGPYRGSGSPTTLKNAGYAEAASVCGESAWRSITGTARFHRPEGRTVGPVSTSSALRMGSTRPSNEV